MRTFIFALLLAGCGLPSEAPMPGERSDAIVGGSVDTGDPAVVALAVGGNGQYQEYCTGTLIAPKTILTAAHCVNTYGPNAPYYALFGTYAAQPSKAVRIISQVKDPLYSSSGSTHDFGVLQLQTAVTDVTPIEINSTPLNTSFIGQSIRHAGFGVTNGTQQSGGGTKRQVTYNVRQVSTALIESGAQGKQTCSGDSGGPAFMVMPGKTVETVVGVVSFGDEACVQYGQDGRVDVAFNWISATMSPWEGPTCAPDNQCKAGCTPVDQDCVCVADGVCSPACADLLKDPDCPKDCVTNGVCAIDACPVPDADCVAEGGTCGNALQCKGRVCTTDDQHLTMKYCTSPCTPGTACGAGMECVPQGLCLLKQKPVKQPGDICTSSDYCASGRLCTGPSGGVSRCVSGCSVQNDCAGGTTCEGGADGQRFCRPPESELRFQDVVLPAATTVEAPAAPASGCAATGVSDLSVLGLALGALSLIRRRRS